VALRSRTLVPAGPHPVADEVRARAPARLVDGVLRRRKWSLHRHIHLVSAFEDARTRSEITTVLAVGCGAGLSELYLAACNPGVAFTLTDFDTGRLRIAQRWVHDNKLDNVEFAPLNLLSPPGPRRYDLVTSTEVLEHIGRDQQAASHMVAVAAKFVWALVPSCTEEALTDPVSCAASWRSNEHVRPGYTERTLSALFEQGRKVWMRSCYFGPEAGYLRRLLNTATDEQIFASRQEILEAAAGDVRDELRHDNTVQGIEILVDTRSA